MGDRQVVAGVARTPVAGPTCGDSCAIGTSYAVTGQVKRDLVHGYNPSYTASMKTAISVPDDVFEQAERAAKRLGLSRSELFTRAVQAFLATRLEQNITSSYNAAFGEAEDSDIDGLRREATRRALLDVEWK